MKLLPAILNSIIKGIYALISAHIFFWILININLGFSIVVHLTLTPRSALHKRQPKTTQVEKPRRRTLRILSCKFSHVYSL